MIMKHIGFLCFPALVLYCWVLCEIVALAPRRRETRELLRGTITRLLVWTSRPWAVWAVFNLVYRANWARGFNNKLTFPFYANLWWEGRGIGHIFRGIYALPGAWLWTLASVTVAAIMFGMLLRILRTGSPGGRRLVYFLVSLFFMTAALHLAVSQMPGPVPMRDRCVRAAEYPWLMRDTTMYNAASMVEDTDSYVRGFVELQPRLQRTIHAASHPPGASLSLYWLGLVAGGGEMCGRTGAMTALTIFAALNVIVVYFLAVALTCDRRIGCVAALLWSVMPASVMYNTFAQDALYSVFFALSLLAIWKTAICDRFSLLASVCLGVLFFCLSMLNYSVCMPGMIFFLFVLWTGVSRKWRVREYLFRYGVPGVTAGLLFVATLAYYRLDYLAMYRNASAFVRDYYSYDGAYQWLAALVGGQLDILLMMGSVVCSAFLVELSAIRKPDLARPGVRMLIVLLMVYAIPVLFGPNCLKMETSRCWNWVVLIPLVFAVSRCMRSERPVLLIAGAWLVSFATAFVMRLFMNFGC